MDGYPEKYFSYALIFIAFSWLPVISFFCNKFKYKVKCAAIHSQAADKLIAENSDDADRLAYYIQLMAGYGDLSPNDEFYEKAVKLSNLYNTAVSKKEAEEAAKQAAEKAKKRKPRNNRTVEKESTAN